MKKGATAGEDDREKHKKVCARACVCVLKALLLAILVLYKHLWLCRLGEDEAQTE